LKRKTTITRLTRPSSPSAVAASSGNELNDYAVCGWEVLTHSLQRTIASLDSERGASEELPPSKKLKSEETALPAAANSTIGWAHLTPDVLRIIASRHCLHYHDHQTCKLVCRHWRAAIDLLRRDEELRIESRCLNKLNCFRKSPDFASICVLTRMVPSQSLLLAAVMTDLKNLACLLQLDSLEGLAFAFPKKLKVLFVQLNTIDGGTINFKNNVDELARNSWSKAHRVMASIAQVTTLTKLTLQLQYNCQDEERPGAMWRLLQGILPLAQSLSTLHLDMICSGNSGSTSRLSSGIYMFLHQLPNLTDLTPMERGDLTLDEVQLVAQGPSASNLRLFNINGTTVTQEMSELLVRRFPSLVRLDCGLRTENPFFITSLAKLESLRLYLDPEVGRELLVVAISGCPEVKILTLHSDKLSTQQLTRIMQAMPMLSKLELDGHRQPTSLVFLTQVPRLARTLRVLSLKHFTVPSLAEVHHLLQSPLSCLRQLTLDLYQVDEGRGGEFASGSVFKRIQWDDATSASFNSASQFFSRSSWPFLRDVLLTERE
jgi:hypothetical protein